MRVPLPHALDLKHIYIYLNTTYQSSAYDVQGAIHVEMRCGGLMEIRAVNEALRTKCIQLVALMVRATVF